MRPMQLTTLSDIVRPLGVDPEHVAVRDGDCTLNWAQLDQLASRAANAFIAAGMQRGERVMLSLGTGVEFVWLYFGALRAGLVVVAVNPAYTDSERQYVLDDSGARLVVSESEQIVVTAPDGSSARAVTDFLEGADEQDPRRDVAGEEIAVILYTSGTSGYPKGAMLSARALLSNLAQLAQVQPRLVHSDDILFVPLPLFHIYGLNAALGMGLYSGASVVLARRFDARSSLLAIHEQGVSAVVGAPGMFVHWSHQPDFAEVFSRVRFALSGSAPLSPALVAQYAEIGVSLFEGYGLTETAPVLTLNAIGTGLPQAGSVGRPLPGVQIQLRDAQGVLIDAEDGDPGQLYVRGENLFSGYWPDGRGGPDPDGWFATGDIAVLDADGSLRLVGRSTDLIIVNGFNVYPAEVERVLSQVAGVAEVAVTGRPDEKTGETVVAFVVPATGMQLDVEQLSVQAAASLARFKRPTQIVIVDALPHTVTGKVQKWRLRDSAV